jgi:molybdopterin/thiamine biosynthesis adenylyltransferase
MKDLTDLQLERYARHVILDEVGEAGQARLLASRVLVVGAGGLGAPLLQYLAAAGVGTLGIIDDDHVELSNLQRQVIHTTRNVGKSKVESAAEFIAAINPEVKVEAHNARLTVANAAELIARYDLVADGSDNFPTRYLLNDACYLGKKPLALKELLGIGESLSGRLLIYDGLATDFRTIRIPRDPACRLCGPQADIHDLSEHIH